MSRDFSLGSVCNGLILHDHVAKHVLRLAVSTSSQAILVNVDELAVSSLDVIPDSRHVLHDLLLHVVVGEFVFLKLELCLSLN